MRAALLALVAIAGCAVGLGPLPAEVDALVDYLERRNLQLTPVDVAYDRAFETVDPDAHVVTYGVTPTTQPARRRPAAALMDVYLFASEAALERGLDGLRRLHSRGQIYVDERTVLYVRGDEPDLTVALGRRFGPPLDA